MITDNEKPKAVRTRIVSLAQSQLPHYEQRISRYLSGIRDLLDLQLDLIEALDYCNLCSEQRRESIVLINQLVGKSYGSKAHTHSAERFKTTLKADFDTYAQLFKVQFKVMAQFASFNDPTKHIRASHLVYTDWFKQWLSITRQQLF